MIVVPLEDMHITANPLPNENCQQCCQKVKDKGHEPESVNMEKEGYMHGCVACLH